MNLIISRDKCPLSQSVATIQCALQSSGEQGPTGSPNKGSLNWQAIRRVVGWDSRSMLFYSIHKNMTSWKYNTRKKGQDCKIWSEEDYRNVKEKHAKTRHYGRELETKIACKSLSRLVIETWNQVIRWHSHEAKKTSQTTGQVLWFRLTLDVRFFE